MAPGRKACGRRKTHLHLQVERLDDRTLPSTFSVSTLADCGTGSLRQAILDANSPAYPGADVINFNVTGTINLASVLPDLSTDIDIEGPGANLLTVTRAVGAPDFRIFAVDVHATVTIAGLTITGGRADSGGGIYNAGRLTINASTFSGNSADAGGAISDAGGGTIRIDACTFSGNSGGGIYDCGGLTLTTSLLTNNVGGNLAGGILSPPYFVSGGHNLFSDTPAAPLDRTDRCNVDPRLGPLQDNGGPTFTCALLAVSPALDQGIAVPGLTTDQRGVPRPQGSAPDIGAFERTTGPFVRLEPDSATELVGTAHTTTATLLDASLQPLEGVTVTFQITAGPDAGVTGTTDPTDGRTGADGRVRFTYNGNHGVGTDVLIATATPSSGPTITFLGATVLWTTLTVTNTNDRGVGSLRAAIVAANQHPGGDTIDFAPGARGTIRLSSPLPDLTTDITLNGPGANRLTVRRDTGGRYRVFTVAAGATVGISGLTVSNGEPDWTVGWGGGIANAGTLTLNNATITNNWGNQGGGLYNSGTVTIAACTFSGSITAGGIYNTGTCTLNSSTVDGNSGGGITNSGTGTLTLNNSTVDGNSGGAGIGNSGTLTLYDSTVYGNAGQGIGGGVYSIGSLDFFGTNVIEKNDASTSNDDIFPSGLTLGP